MNIFKLGMAIRSIFHSEFLQKSVLKNTFFRIFVFAIPNSNIKITCISPLHFKHYRDCVSVFFGVFLSTFRYI